MEQIRKNLTELFDEMLNRINSFKRKKYSGVFEESYEEFKNVFTAVAELLSDVPEDEKTSTIEELAAVIPDHAYTKLQSEPKMKRSRLEVDYNMNMAVYIVPMFTYSHDTDCEKIAERMVALWNEKPVTSLTLGQASYETIAGGFRKGFCFITSAVCDSMNKPDDCYELTTLRTYRDEYLCQTEEGRILVDEYYEVAPYLVQVINMHKNASDIYNGIYEKYLLPCITCIEQKKNEECREIYIDMVRGLQKKYLYA